MPWKTYAVATIAAAMSLAALNNAVAQETENDTDGCMAHMTDMGGDGMGHMGGGGEMRNMMRMMHRMMGRGQGQGPAVVINIYPDGRVETPEMQSMDRAGTMMMHHEMPARTMSEDDIRAMMTDHMAAKSMALEVGEIDLIDDDIAAVDLMTPDGMPHHRMIVNRHTGRMMRAN